MEIEFVDDLFPHQKEAVSKLRQWENEQKSGIKGGILAFKMGLGKTRTMLELIWNAKCKAIDRYAATRSDRDAPAHSREDLISRVCNPSLIVCGKSNIQVWKNDIEKFYNGQLSYFILHSSYLGKSQTLEEITQSFLGMYDVIITTYEVVRRQFSIAEPKCYVIRENNFMPIESELYMKHQIPEKYKIVTVKKPSLRTPSAPPPSYNQSLTHAPPPFVGNAPSEMDMLTSGDLGDGNGVVFKYTPIYSRRWFKIIADESQRFAGTNTVICQAMIALLGHSYFCLSGTPIVNYDTDLYSFFRFMGLFTLPRDWNARYYRLMNLQSRILIKDYKDTTIVLPELNSVHVKVELSGIEKQMYNSIVIMLRDAMAKFQRGEVSFAAPLAMFTRLRQICICGYVLAKESKRVDKSQEKLDALKSIQSLRNDELDEEAREELEREIETEEARMAGDAFFKDERLENYIKNKDNIPNYTKVKKSMDIIDNIVREGGKVLVFSSFVGFLDVLKKLIEEKYAHQNELGSAIGVDGNHTVECQRPCCSQARVMQMDGSVNDARIRDDMVKKFNTDKNYKIFLSTYKAGGVGINLTGADNVLLIEPWWNFATEEQAIFRSYRVGQTKPVNVYSLLAIPSFETYLIQIQERKRTMTREYLDNYTHTYSKLSDQSIAKDLIQHIVNGYTWTF